MPSDLTPSPVAAVPSVTTAPQSFSTFTADEEVRWAAWLARGRQHHLTARRRLRVGLLIGAAVAAVAISLFGAPNTW